MHWIALPWPTTELGQPAAENVCWWALHITPRVVRCDEVLLLEVSTTERLWGGRDAVLQRVLQAAGQPLTDGLWSTGSTALVAMALLRLRVRGEPAPSQVPDGLPLGLLTALRPHQSALQSVGCRTWGHVRAMPRAGVARRWGREVLQALDEAYGAQAQPHDWLQLPEQFSQSIELAATAITTEGLLQGVQPLLTTLHHWLQARQQGVLALELAWRHDLRRLDGKSLPPSDSLVLRVARPAQDLDHVQRLLVEHLAHRVLQAPTQQASLRVLESASLPHTSASLLPPGAWPFHAGKGCEGAEVVELLERLSARLGVERVQIPVLHDDHRPEAMQGWAPATGRGGHDSHLRLPLIKRDVMWWPTWLLRPPRRLQCQGSRPCWQGPLTLLAGPHRLEAGWWSPWLDAEEVDAQVVVRDYFMAHNERAGLVWVYRLRSPTAEVERGLGDSAVHWFLQGWYG